jgi:SAM-dependent methyltransferase
MKPDSALYNSPRLAAGYAYARPAVHPRVLQRVRDQLHLSAALNRALDIGCGAGRSTAALDGFAHHVVGLDPAARMMEHRRVVAPRASFVAGQAERLPFADNTFDLVTAAGSINYADRSLALPEIARVLSRDGMLVIYDFSPGRRLVGSGLLEDWYAEFEQRYPDAPGYALDVRRVPFDRAGITFQGYHEFDVLVAMTLESYCRYVMSETRVERARLAGANEADIRQWCRLTLEEVLDDEPRDIVFQAYAAYAAKGVPPAPRQGESDADNAERSS